MKIFLIGPGGVGKSTTGKILATRLDHEFVDLDQEFCERIENVGTFIRSRDYRTYCHTNSELFFTLLEEMKDKNFVCALSSGFLVHKELDELTSKHYATIQDKGVSITLLPSLSIEESTDIVVKRQLTRGFGLHEDDERRKFQERFPLYQVRGDIVHYSYELPDKIAHDLQQKLLSI